MALVANHPAPPGDNTSSIEHPKVYNVKHLYYVKLVDLEQPGNIELAAEIYISVNMTSCL
jgi:hypothetical protein